MQRLSEIMPGCVGCGKEPGIVAFTDTPGRFCVQCALKRQRLGHEAPPAAEQTWPELVAAELEDANQ